MTSIHRKEQITKTNNKLVTTEKKGDTADLETHGGEPLKQNFKVQEIQNGKLKKRLKTGSYGDFFACTVEPT